ncbi:hypothetical protein [Kribbella sp. NPDC006257]|uniref:hypothetical protein n=1 Tax=Kribbella sp. NPDC006257 TaxID=3156738 RepID=UPI0033A28456
MDSTLADEPILWPLLAVGYLVNLVVHWTIWRGGWVIKVYAPDKWRAVSKTRYPSKPAALAALDRQRALAPKFPPPEAPACLPTRGGTLRRPW